MADTTYFKDIETYSSPEIPEGYQSFEKAKTMQIGFGSKVFRGDRRGIWLGAEEPADAPFWVDMEGNMVATSLDLSNYLQVGEALSDIGAGNITGTYIANGTITTAKLIAGEIVGFTVTGGTVRTSSGSTRVEMSGSNNRLDIYASGTRRMSLDGDSIEFYNSSGTKTAEMNANSGYALLIDGSGSTYETVLRYNATYGMLIQANTTNVAKFYNGGLQMLNGATLVTYGLIPNLGSSVDVGSSDNPYNSGYFSNDLHVGDNIHMQSGGYIENFTRLIFSGTTANPTGDGTMLYYDSGTEGLRMQFGGSDFQFDATAV